MKIDELHALLEKEKDNIKDLAAVNKLFDEVTEATEEVSEENTEETTEEVTEEMSEEAAEEETTEEVSEEASEETAEEEDHVDLSAVFSVIEDLRKENADLRDQLQAVTEELAAKKKDEADFVERFKNLSISVKETKEPAKPHKVGMTNGIGVLK